MRECGAAKRPNSRLQAPTRDPTPPRPPNRPPNNNQQHAQVLDRGEKLDLLVDKTELLQGEALAFRRGAARARRVMWWHNARSWLAAAGAVAAVVLVIVMLNCGITLSKCG